MPNVVRTRCRGARGSSAARRQCGELGEHCTTPVARDQNGSSVEKCQAEPSARERRDCADALDVDQASTMDAQESRSSEVLREPLDRDTTLDHHTTLEVYEYVVPGRLGERDLVNVDGDLFEAGLDEDDVGGAAHRVW